MIKIALGGVEYNLTFNMGFLEKVYEEFGLSLLGGTDPSQNFLFIKAVIYCGIVCHFEEVGKEMPISKDECLSLIKKLHPIKVMEAITAYNTWMTTPEEIPMSKKEVGGKASKFRVAEA